MQQEFHELSIRTPGRGFTMITRDIDQIIRNSSLDSGLATMVLQHTSASLLIQENADPDVRVDFESWMGKTVCDGDPDFVHTMEGEDDMAAHIRTALTTINLSIPFRNKNLTLGTWQGIYLWEHRYRPHHRQITIHLIGE